MNCENCGKEVSSWGVRYGDRESIFCKDCFGTEEAQRIIDAKANKAIKTDSQKYSEQNIITDLQWYYSADGETQMGPVSEEELIKAIQKKEIFRSSLVWNEKLSDWKRVEDLSQFKEHFKVVPPPLPRQRIDEEVKSSTDLYRSVGNSQKKSFPKEDISSSDLEEKASNKKDLPTRWLNFYVNGWLPVGIIANLLGFSGDLSNEEIIFQIVWILFLALTFFGLKNREKWGLYLNWLIIFWLPIGGALMFVDHPYFVGYLLGGLVIFTVPNAIYFKKRKDLFNSKSDVKVANAKDDITFFNRNDKLKTPDNHRLKDLLTDSTYMLISILGDFENRIANYSRDLPVYLCYELNIRGYAISADLVERLNQFSQNEFQINFFDLTESYKL